MSEYIESLPLIVELTPEEKAEEEAYDEWRKPHRKNERFFGGGIYENQRVVVAVASDGEIHVIDCDGFMIDNDITEIGECLFESSLNNIPTGIGLYEWRGEIENGYCSHYYYGKEWEVDYRGKWTTLWKIEEDILADSSVVERSCDKTEAV